MHNYHALPRFAIQAPVTRLQHMSLYLLPGMGATAAMYQGPWHALCETTFLDWPDYHGEQHLRAVAERLIEEYQIPQQSAVGGSSLGGMVALEIAQLLDSHQVFLIGSALHKAEINRLLRLLAPFANITPLRLTQILAGSCSWDIGDMFQQSDPEFIRAMCLAIEQWPGSTLPDERIVRIHGNNDHFITCPTDACVVNGAGHLLAMTHAQECVDWLKGTNGD